MNHFIPSLQPEEGAAENVVLLPPKESQNDSVQVQCVCVCTCDCDCDNISLCVGTIFVVLTGTDGCLFLFLFFFGGVLPVKLCLFVATFIMIKSP